MNGREIEIYRGTGGELEQAFYESALRDAGIDFVIKSEGISQYPVSVGPMSSFAIFVSPEDESKARELVRDLQKAPIVSEGDDGKGEDPPRLVLGKQKRTERDRKAFLAFGTTCAAAGLYLLFPYRDASVFGILILICAALFLAASR